MATLLEITGTLQLVFTDKRNNIVSDELQKEIIEKLKTNEYCIGLSTKKVFVLPSLNHLYNFDFEVCDDTDYNFVNKED
jgi:hypothetical protein